MTELNWMQEYAAAEAIALREEGVLSRRDMLVRLVAICGSVSAATAFLASWVNGSAKSTSSAATSTQPGGDTTTSSTVGRPPVTGGPSGHVLSVAATDPDVKADKVTFPGPASTMLGYLAQPAARGKY